MKKTMINAWCLLYGVYACVGDWMVDQVDHNDYLAGFLFAFLIYAVLTLGGFSMDVMTVVWNQ